MDHYAIYDVFGKRLNGEVYHTQEAALLGAFNDCRISRCLIWETDSTGDEQRDPWFTLRFPKRGKEG